MGRRRRSDKGPGLLLPLLGSLPPSPSPSLPPFPFPPAGAQVRDGGSSLPQRRGGDGLGRNPHPYRAISGKCTEGGREGEREGGREGGSRGDGAGQGAAKRVGVWKG